MPAVTTTGVYAITWHWRPFEMLPPRHPRRRAIVRATNRERRREAAAAYAMDAGAKERRR